jgi:hypothetical protein
MGTKMITRCAKDLRRKLDHSYPKYQENDGYEERPKTSLIERGLHIVTLL